jgi:autotransporter-associated beta strand protein
MSKSLAVQLAGGIFGILFPALLPALDVTGYTPARHNRFASGYPTNPVANTDPSFIGSGYDWSGIGWDANLASRSVAMLGPTFFLEAKHYALGAGVAVNFFPANAAPGSAPISRTVQASSGGLGPSSSSDLCIGTLSSPLTPSDHVAYYPILFLGYSTSSYLNQNLLVYGFTSRIGTGTVNQVSEFTDTSGYYFSLPFNYAQDSAAFQSGDSGSPSFFVAGGNIYLAGAHYAVDQLPNPTVGFDSALPMMLNYVEDYMAASGYLPYVVTPPTAAWTGASGNSWGTGGNWSTGAVPVDLFTGSQVTTCASVLFDGDAAASQRTISLGATRMVTGLTFKSESGANAFTFSAGQTLQIGEAGIVNNDLFQQVFNCNMLLRSSQRWNGGAGGLYVTGTVNTGSSSSGNLLVIDGSANSLISGAISGTGALALNGTGVLTLSGANSYSGKTFILAGRLQVGSGGASGTLGSGNVVNNTVLTFTRSNDFTVANLISGSGNLEKKGAGALTLTGSNSYTGSTSVLNGVLKLGNASALGNAAVGATVSQGAALDLNGQTVGSENISLAGSGSAGSGALINGNTATSASLAGAVQLTGAASVGGPGNLTLTGSLNLGGRTLTKSGSGTTTLQGSTTWGNGASILAQAGTLAFDLQNGAAVSLGKVNPTLTVNSSAAVNVHADYADPFTDSLNSAIHVQIVNDSSAGLNFLSGNSQAAGISGSGNTILADGASLTTPSLTQNSLTIGDGGGRLAASAAAVPEPATFILILSAAILGLLFRYRRF